MIRLLSQEIKPYFRILYLDYIWEICWEHFLNFPARLKRRPLPRLPASISRNTSPRRPGVPRIVPRIVACLCEAEGVDPALPVALGIFNVLREAARCGQQAGQHGGPCWQSRLNQPRRCESRRS